MSTNEQETRIEVHPIAGRISGYPGLEEAYHVAELLFPRLPVDLRAAQSDSLAAV